MKRQFNNVNAACCMCKQAVILSIRASSLAARAEFKRHAVKTFYSIECYPNPIREFLESIDIHFDFSVTTFTSVSSS